MEKICWRTDRLPTPVFSGFPCGSAGKEFAHNAGDLGSVPGLGRSFGEGKDYPLKHSGLEISMDCIIHGVAESDSKESDGQQRVGQTTKKESDSKERVGQQRVGRRAKSRTDSKKSRTESKKSRTNSKKSPTAKSRTRLSDFHFLSKAILNVQTNSFIF